ncbi:dihydrodipicolinate synthase family protein [Amycolatopsis sp. NPDC051372]|uniref:dihydrodipicolinate synthase family protein n=1 Tax=Amycolatopsis sp. NPDC051372 TaxID=3155669 RepID=UPI00341864FE
MPAFSGVIPPIVTPLLDDRSVDVTSLKRLIDYQLDAGVHGVFVLGSSGEAVYLSDSDRRTVAEVTVSHTAGRVPVLLGALDTTPARVVEQLNLFSGLPADGVVVTAPFYANPSDSEVAEHFRAICSQSPLPVLAYDIPGNVGRRIPLQVSIDLLGAGVLAGIKDSSGTLTEFRRILDALGPGHDAAVLTGADVLADLALNLGADGLIPGLANARPDLFVGLYDAHRKGDAVAVAKHQRAINVLVDIFGAGQPHGLGRHSSELGALKTMLHRRGVIATTAVSAPLTRYDEAAIASLDAILERVPL